MVRDDVLYGPQDMTLGLVERLTAACLAAWIACACVLDPYGVAHSVAGNGCLCYKNHVAKRTAHLASIAHNPCLMYLPVFII